MNLNEAWKSTCKVLLGHEVGELKDYEQFLIRYTEPIKKARSVLSGKEVYYSAPYCENARFISQDEFEQLKTEPIKLNEMKDIDSILNAVGERFHYAGNKLGGKIRDVTSSENCVDAFSVTASHDIYNSENIAYCQMMKNNKYMFGCCWGTDSNFCINSTEMEYASRQFESTLCINTTDSYYSFNCNGCHDVMFCFNQRASRYAIGNSILEKTKYRSLKQKLLSEIAENLKKDKTIPSLIEVATGGVS